MLALFVYVTLMQTVPKYMVSLGKEGPLCRETTLRESSMLYVFCCLGKTAFFAAVPKREPLNILCVVVLLSPTQGARAGGSPPARPYQVEQQGVCTTGVNSALSG